jgi:hypothetical protein
VRCRETDGESIDQGEEKCAEKPVVQANRPTALNEKASYPSKSAKILFSQKISFKFLFQKKGFWPICLDNWLFRSRRLADLLGQLAFLRTFLPPGR